MPTFEQIDRAQLGAVEKAMAQMLVVTAMYVQDLGYDATPVVSAIDTLMGAWA